MNGELGMEIIAARCEIVGHDGHSVRRGGGGWECARPLNQHLLGHLLSRGGNRTFLSEGVADGNGRCVGGRGGVGGREGGAAVTCPVRLGREPSAGGTIFHFSYLCPLRQPCLIFSFTWVHFLSRIPHL